MGDGPASYYSIVDFSNFDADDELLGTLANPLLEVLHELTGVLAEINVNSFGLSLQNTVLIYKYEPHPVYDDYYLLLDRITVEM